jgi:outer membrane protein assembly factor BamB
MNRIGALAVMGLAFAACAAQAPRPLVDPFPLRFPLVEAGRLEIDGHVAGQPRGRDGIVYYATREGQLTAVVARSRSLLWRRPVDGADPDSIGQAVSPVDAAGHALKIEGPRLQAIDGADRIIWEFAAEGTISVEPVARDGRVYFGTAERMFYCLDAKSGKKVWSRRLQGAALHPAVVRDGSVAVAASNSVVYRLSAKGGSILSWEAIPSRVVYELAAAGPLLLVSSAAPTVMALDMRSGSRAGLYAATGSLVAGAVWSSPYVVLFMEDAESGRERIVFLKSSGAQAAVEKTRRLP